MAGRIRTIKPEILEDDRTSALSDLEWRIFVSSILLADDFGNFRAHPHFVLSQVFWGIAHDADGVGAALDTLEDVGLIERYEVRGQHYAHIRNWDKHQRVDNRGRPRVPAKDDPEALAQTVIYVYFVQQGDDGPIKIGRAANVERRLGQLRVANPQPLRLLATIEGDIEAELKQRFKKLRISGEWFKPAEELRTFIGEVAAKSPRKDTSSPLARAPAHPAARPRPTTTTTTTTTTPAPSADAEVPVGPLDVKPKAKAGSRGTRIAADWKPSEKTIEWCHGKGVDGAVHVEEFIDHWAGVSGAKGVKLDWDGTFKNRIRDLIEWGRATPWEPVVPPEPVGPLPKIDRSGPEWERALAGIDEALETVLATKAVGV
jgi:Meiotically up-regulated gene 113